MYNNFIQSESPPSILKGGLFEVNPGHVIPWGQFPFSTPPGVLPKHPPRRWSSHDER